ncbi:TIGR03759 family integrating conjugative element protein [Vibrio sinensis]|uniref:TIGR03759 family integrating conjugative element protein n=1 Tax=Vibrio sinensis TaxID=2302434 RepID=A0A3A6QGT1_9VIBR|nr:TIGR03759 family integrating conjugative element protein [Vibrio sinensis]RJX68660.1 TIGR03759 family integrating conjugative element protein [Vibrio sinensis]
MRTIWLLALIVTSSVMADDVVTVNNEIIKESFSAQDWQLSDNEWSRYQALINKPEAYGLIDQNPLVILGQFARTDEERRRYAQRLVVIDKKRIDGLLALDKAYRHAWQALYPTLTPIGQSLPERVSLFVTANCEPCIDVLKAWRTRGVKVDVFMVDSKGNDFTLRQWASLAGVRQSDVSERFITLNHDQRGLWFNLAKGQSTPVAAFEQEGVWSVIALPSSY